MNCPNCNLQIPAEALDPCFCVACGYPVSQVCPYADPDQPHRLMLLDGDGHAPGACPHCRNLLLACETCCRLHRLEEPRCRTAGCVGPLRESTESFSGEEGALDGGRYARVRGSLTRLSTVPVAIQDSEDFVLLAYRYGLLIGVSRRNVSSYSWKGKYWYRENITALAPAAAPCHSLRIEKGSLFLQAADRAMRLPLPSLALELNLPERGICQLRQGDWWLRVTAEQNGDNALLMASNLQKVSEKTISLPFRAVEAGQLALLDQTAFIAADSGLFRIDLASGQVENLESSGVRWRRVTSAGGMVTALGVDSSGETLLLRCGTTGAPDGPFSAGRGWNTELVCLENEIWLARTGTLARFAWDQLSERPAQLALPSGQPLHPGCLGLIDRNGVRRALIRVGSQNRTRLQLVDPDSGAQVPVGGGSEFAGDPLVCMANDLLVVAAREGDRMVLSSYQFGEGL